MLDTTTFDALAKKLFAVIPNSMHQVDESIQLQFKHILQSTFASLDLVTREEFDVQTKVLARTREKLTALEQQVSQLQK